MREFLSARNTPFVERNIRRDPEAQAELLALTGELVVPVVVAGARQVVGYDPDLLEAILASGALPAAILPPRDSTSREQGRMAARREADLAATVADLLARVREELAYNAAKGSGPYRRGMHDGLRFAEDALSAILEQYPGGADLPAAPEWIAQLDA